MVTQVILIGQLLAFGIGRSLQKKILYRLYSAIFTGVLRNEKWEKIHPVN